MDSNLSCLTSRTKFNERNDCSVRALSIALNVDYETIHKLCAKNGREPKKGFDTHRAFGMSFGRRKKTVIFKGIKISYRKVGKHQPTIPTFLKKHPTGRFVCVKSRHAFAIIDGKVYGQETDNSRIKYFMAIKLKTNETDNQNQPECLDNTETVLQDSEAVQAECSEPNQQGQSGILAH